jgi:putative DNA primase/helicase
MMDFLTFCRVQGILIDHLPLMGEWKRYPTEDHPRSRNGAVKYLGTHGFAQNHALSTEVSLWQSEEKYDLKKQESISKLVQDAEREKLTRQKAAADKAAFILKNAQFAQHQYLKDKGFPDEHGYVFLSEGISLLVIPMRVKNALVGVQLIDPDGNKRFLFGQRTSNAEFIFDNKGPHIFCEGYATALSIRLALKNLKKRYTIHVCFSAGNMLKVSDGMQGHIVCDNDESKTGENTAKRIGLPFWISEIIGEDFNDFQRRLGLFKAGQSLTQSLKFG